MSNPCISDTSSDDVPVGRFPFVLYWNALLAVLALALHCIPFAAYQFLRDDGMTGRSLFPLAPLALMIMLACVLSVMVQLILAIVAFASQSSERYHRLCSIAITFLALFLMLVAGRFGWFIHV